MTDRPRVSIRCANEDKQYTLVLLDVDHSDLGTQKRVQRLLWLRYSIEIFNGRHGIGKANPTGTAAVPYTPPRPERGTGTHRLAFVLLEQKAGQAGVPVPPSPEFTLRRHLLEDAGLSISGLAFCRTFWTKHVADGRIFGTITPVYKGPQLSRYAII